MGKNCLIAVARTCLKDISAIEDLGKAIVAASLNGGEVIPGIFVSPSAGSHRTLRFHFTNSGFDPVDPDFSGFTDAPRETVEPTPISPFVLLIAHLDAQDVMEADVGLGQKIAQAIARRDQQIEHMKTIPAPILKSMNASPDRHVCVGNFSNALDIIGEISPDDGLGVELKSNTAYIRPVAEMFPRPG